jgi:hypothetical protein
MNIEKNRAEEGPFARHARDGFIRTSAIFCCVLLSLKPSTMTESLAELQVQYQDFLQGEVRLLSAWLF